MVRLIRSFKTMFEDLNFLLIAVSKSCTKSQERSISCMKEERRATNSTIVTSSLQIFVLIPDFTAKLIDVGSAKFVEDPAVANARPIRRSLKEHREFWFLERRDMICLPMVFERNKVVRIRL